MISRECKLYKPDLRFYLPEIGVWCETVKFLLKLQKPQWRQMHVLEHHPATRLGRRVDRLVRLVEALRRTWQKVYTN